MVMRSIAVAALALIAGSGAALAQTQQVCGGDVSVSGSVSGTIDPFAPSSTVVTATINVQRTVLTGQSPRTKDFFFYFVPDTGTFPSGSTIAWTGAPTSNLLYPTGTLLGGLNNQQGNPAGTISVESATGGFYLHVGFGTSSVTESYPVTLNFTLGIFSGEMAGSHTFPLDIVYECKGTGTQTADVNTPTLQANGVTVSLEVLSGLQATYAGPALDFGPIGGVSTGGATVSGNFDIKSSGVFTIDLSSANKFLMTYTGGPTTTPNAGTIQYDLGFLGQTNLTPSNLSGAMSTVTCSQAGTPSSVSGFVTIPITAKLLEGGQGKTPANYSDQLSVTFTPLVGSAPDPNNTCQNLSDTPP